MKSFKKFRNVDKQNKKYLNPEITARLLLWGVVFMVAGMFSLAFIKDAGVITDKTAISISCGILGVHFVIMIIDTVARPKSVTLFRSTVVMLYVAYIIKTVIFYKYV